MTRSGKRTSVGADCSDRCFERAATNVPPPDDTEEQDGNDLENEGGGRREYLQW